MKIKSKVYNSKIIIFLIIIILGIFQTNSYAIENTKTAITNWYKNYQDSSGNSTYYDTTTITETEKGATNTRTIYKTFKQAVKEGKRGDKVAFILDMIRRNPAFCMELGTSEPDPDELYLYTLSYKINFDGLLADRSEDGVTTDGNRKSKTTDNAKMSYILCNRYSGWYNWDTTNCNGEKEGEHSSECIKDIETENLEGYNNFCTTGSTSASTIKHNGKKYSKQTLYMNSGQVALWNFWRTWIEGDGNKDVSSGNVLYTTSLFSYGARDVDTYLKSSVPDSTLYGNYAEYILYQFRNAVSALKVMRTRDYISESFMSTLKKYEEVLYNNIQNNPEPDELEHEKLTKEAENYASYLEKQDIEKSIDETKDMKPTSETKYKYNEKNEEKQVDTSEFKEKEQNKLILRDIKNSDNNFIKVVEEGEYYKIGPINIDFSKQDKFGAISSIELYNNEKTLISDATNLIDENGNKITSSNIQIMVALNNSEQQSDICQKKDITVLNIQTKENIYFKVPKAKEGIDKILNNLNFTLKVKQVRQLRNSLMVPIFTKDIDNGFNGEKDKQRFIFIDPQPNDSIVEATFENVPVQTEKGKLKIVKVDSDGNKWAIKGIKFNVVSSEGKIVANLETDENGEATTGDLVPGTYTIKETSVPEGYTLRTDTETVTVIKNTTTQLNFANPAIPTIDIAGTVWLDKPIVMVKDGVLDYTLQNSDERMSNITVKLYGTSKGTLQTETKSDGTYVFENIEQRDIENLYVEFEYNGYKYQSVPKLQKAIISGGKVEYITTDKYDTTVSKAEEGSNRETYNQQYKTIDRNSNIPYIDPQREGGVTKTDYDKFPNIVASTKLAEINFDQNDLSNDGFRLYVNLGLMERPEADFALFKDIYKATVTIDGEEKSTMTYNKRSGDGYIEEEDGAEKWAQIVVNTEYDTGQMITRSDLNNSIDKMQLYVTYVIDVTNQSGVTGTIGQIVDYCDDIFVVDSIQYADRVSTAAFQENGTVNYSSTPGEIVRDASGVDRTKIYIQNEKPVPNGEHIYFLVKLRLKDPVKTLGDLEPVSNQSEATEENKKRTINYSEINSYSTNEGLIDKDSAPGNFDIAKYKFGETPLEDDEATSPSFIIKLAKENEITPILTGTVWNDAKTALAESAKGEKIIDNTVAEAEIGDGYYNTDSGDTAMKDVVVELWKKEGESDNLVNSTTTDSNGQYKFENVLGDTEKGTYYLKYKIDDAQNNEATLYNVDNIYNEVEVNKKWYKTNTSTSMAKENSVERINLNANKEQTKNTSSDNIPIYATTPEMEIEKEYTTDLTAATTKDYYINFGIMERPKSRLTVSTYIDSVEILASDGKTIISSTKNLTEESGAIKGKGLIYKEGNSSGYKIRDTILVDKGTLYNLQVYDSNLSNSTLKVKYKVFVNNTGEVDFTGNSDYTTRYKKEGDKYIAEGDVVTTKVDKLFVYMPSNLKFDKENSGKWDSMSKDNIQDDISTTDLNNIDVFVTIDGEPNASENSPIINPLKPGESQSDHIQMITGIDPITVGNGNINFITSTEVIKSTNEVGKILSDITLGDLDPKPVLDKSIIIPEGKKLVHNVITNDIAEDAVELQLTPETGDKKIPYIILLATLIALAGGIIIIKKKVIKKY